MIRGILGVVVGYLVWMAGFFILAVLLSLVWHDYAVHARDWTRHGVYSFAPLMAACNLVFWVIAELAGGWTAAKISKRPAAVWVLAAIIAIYLAVLHFYVAWSRFPWWYNAGVVLPSVAAVVLGGRLALFRRSGPATR